MNLAIRKCSILLNPEHFLIVRTMPSEPKGLQAPLSFGLTDAPLDAKAHAGVIPAIRGQFEPTGLPPR
jgi:hypothetical protein